MPASKPATQVGASGASVERHEEKISSDAPVVVPDSVSAEQAVAPPAPALQYVNITDPLEIKNALDSEILAFFASLGFQTNQIFSNIRLGFSAAAVVVALVAYLVFSDLKSTAHVAASWVLIVAYFALQGLMTVFLMYCVGNEVIRCFPLPTLPPSVAAAVADGDLTPGAVVMATSLLSATQRLRIGTSLPHYETGYKVDFALGEHTWSQTLEITEFFDTRGVFLPHRFHAALEKAALNPKRN